MKKTIYYQGSFDGACFMYSLVNGMNNLRKGLSYKKLEKLWNERLQEIPFYEDFLFGDEGTRKFDDSEPFLTEACERFFNYHNPKRKEFKIEMIKNVNCVHDVQEHLDKNSVLIADLFSGAHWVCVVGYSGNKFLICCSMLENFGKEKFKNDRAYNKVMELSDKQLRKVLYEQRFIKITKI